MITLSTPSGKAKLLPYHGKASHLQHSLSHSLSTSPVLTGPTQPPARFSCRQARGLTVVTRAGPTTNQYVFAFVMPLSLIAVTVFTSMRIADKLDEDFLEEIAINQAIRETDEDDEVDMPIEEKPALPRTRNRPKREV
ncbi:PREDICTED: uncharacterized protein LOC103337170 [Prunus mume]|uniref:Uncharacterized protein LOC103337170 n=1 Tax=Prunus mume TaxID=102107 RepID=A0ABM0PEP1_PRUMU|nr:PREDICTED: uncharacterized protein LOC103337170 [Prunus mume]